MAEPRRVLGAELDKELLRLQLLTARLWQTMAGLGLVVSAVVAHTVAAHLGGVCAIGAAVLLGCFLLQHRLLRRRRARVFASALGLALEGTVPWAFFLLIAVTQGPAYALGSWVPPLLFAMIIVVSTVRLQPAAPLMLGLSAGVLFPLLYFTLVRAQLPPQIARQPLYGPVMQLTRAVSLAFGGALAALASRQLRRAIYRADMAAREHELFGKYRLGRLVAAGGMGTVFEAVYCPEGGFERPVAVKRIHPHLAAYPRFVQAFRSEAELSARLVHPNVVQVLDFGRVEGSYFFAMEFVDGITLRALMRRLRRGGIAVDEGVVVYLGRELLAGLGFAHAGARAADGQLLRVIHRDLCPANVLLSHNGEVKITDFGVAKALREAETSETKTVVGHAAYMSPEQAWGQPLDGRSDLFAVAVVLWELLCGRPLFARSSEGRTFFAIVSDPAAVPSELRQDIDPAWDQLLERGLAKDADERFATAGDMASALAQLDVEPAGSEVLAALVREVVALPEAAEAGADDVAASEDVPTRVVRSG